MSILVLFQRREGGSKGAGNRCNIVKGFGRGGTVVDFMCGKTHNEYNGNRGTGRME